jgi:acetyl-CoA C-acetyltransferase
VERDVLVDGGDDRLPCLVGTARRTWHPGDTTPEPLDMWSEVARLAADDVGVDRDVLAEVDDLGVVHCQSWAYDHPADRAADALGLGGVRRQSSILAGTSPQRLLDDAAGRMLRGESEVALVVGGEALWSRRQYDRAGELPPWRHPHPTPPTLPIDLDTWYLPTEIAHGILPAWLTFALLDQARWAERGAMPGVRRELVSIMGRLSAVAAANPGAWFRDGAPGEELVLPGPGNRLIATPYAKRTTAFLDVDMAAANVLVTKGVADRWGVPEDRRAYLRGWGFARDAVHIAARGDLTTSPAMGAATSEALGAAGVDVDEVDAFDLYSCFGSAVLFACDALGISVDDPRPLSLTGGLAYHGGPSSNYVGHSVSHVVDHLRQHPDDLALTTGVGMHMTKHVAAVWSGRPGPIFGRHEHGPQHWDDGDHADERAVLDSWSGPATLMAASVVYRSDGDADHVVGIAELADGARCYVRSERPPVIDLVAADGWAHAPIEVRPTATGTNELLL